MTKKTELGIKILKILNPVDTVKWVWTKMKKHKVMLLIATFIAIFQTGLCVNLDPVANFFTQGTLLSDSIISELHVNLSEPIIADNLQAVYEALVPIGQSIALLVWMIGLAEISMRDDLTPELIAKDFIKIVVTLIIIGNYALDIITYVTDLFNSILDMIEGIVPTDVSGVAGASGGAFSNVPLGKLGTAFLAIGLLSVLKMIVSISVSITVWTRKFKLIIFAAASPLGLYDFRDGFHSSSANFIRRYCALCMQGVMIVVINAIATGIISSTIGTTLTLGTGVLDSINMFIKIAPICLVLCTFMKSTEHLAGDILGVH